MTNNVLQPAPDEGRTHPATDLQALVFNIKRCSFEDGPGIRTTVFLKGCPLRCLWCCNPEGQETHRELTDPSVTKEFFERYMTVDELFAVVEKDLPFFHASGGGVSIAGGEATMHHRFVHALIQKCKEHSIHTILDTCGYAVGKSAELLTEADMLLYDVKLIREDEHIRFTGVSNRPILENLRRLVALGRPIIVRVPVVPGYTDSDENITAIGRLLSDLGGIQRVDLIAFHSFAKSKYAALGKSHILDAIRTPTNSEMQRIMRRLEDYSPQVQLGG